MNECMNECMYVYVYVYVYVHTYACETQEAEAAHQEAMSHMSDKFNAKTALLEKQAIDESASNTLSVRLKPKPLRLNPEPDPYSLNPEPDAYSLNPIPTA